MEVSMKKVVLVARILKWAAVALCLGLPVVDAGYWISEGYPFLAGWFSLQPLPEYGEIPIGWSNLTGVQKLLGFLTDLIPTAFSVIALAYLAMIFQSFERLEFFDQKNVGLLKKSAMALLIGQLIYPIHVGFMSLILTFYNPVGKRAIYLGFGSDQLKMVAVALAIFLISWILKEGCKLQEESEGIV